jgi:lipid-binding SYLF domain-containing protein
MVEAIREEFDINGNSSTSKWIGRFAMIRKLAFGVCIMFVASSVFAANKEQKRLENSGTVLQEVMNVPDNIPQELLEKAECIIVFPSVLKAAFVVGGSYGRGAMVCRTGEHFKGPWGSPAMYALEGASVGFQLGGQATDLVLLVMNERGASSILNSKVKLGADASAAAGPKGRDASANTDAYMRAEILSYSRTRGLFAGVSLEGSTLRPDDDANADVYGRKITAREIVLGNKVAVPSSGRLLVRVLQKNAPHNESEKASNK